MFVTVLLHLDLCSFLLLINAAYPSLVLLDPLENFPFTCPNLLHVLFLFQFFKQEFSIHFCLLNSCCVSRSFRILWFDHPKTICWKNVSRSFSLWSLLQPSVSSCMFVTNILLSTLFLLHILPQMNWSIVLRMKCNYVFILENTCLFL